ncbi:MAG: efflux RND transporter periplasmic adaptor subunit [Deltaproteobacteria bacterium]|nr:efflux RND transporter periplasmic adaptor subunit [Deltaproteobacteria bacterium]
MIENRQKPIYLRMARLLLPLIIIAVGGVAWAYFNASAPAIERKPPERQVRTVQIKTIVQTEARTSVNAMGTVVPSMETTLKARVSGTVTDISSEFIPGGHISKGASILSLDKSDHEVEVRKAESSLESAKAELAIEQGSQTIAREELRLLSESSSEDIPQTDLALRKPQLQQAIATVASAEAGLRQAMLDLERTEVKAPFNALIIDRNVNIGAYVTPGETLTTLVGTDELWVEALVSLDQLKMIDLEYPGGCPAVVRSQTGNGAWEGKVVRVSGKLNDSSRMATVIISVSDPLGLAKKSSVSPMMIQDYVNVEITGSLLPDIIEIPRSALHDDNTVWVCSNNSLDIRSVTIVWKSTDKIYISGGLTTGEQVILSDLSAPVQGMALKASTMENNADNS